MIKINQKGNTAILSVIFVVLLLILTGVAVHFWRNFQRVKTNELSYKLLNSPTRNKVVESSTTNQEQKETSPSSNSMDKELTYSPVVVYTPSGLFASTEVTELNDKLIYPYEDFAADNSIIIASITVEKTAQPISGYKYKVSYVNQGGGNGGFLFGNSDPIEWWIPECMGGCDFSASFKAKYPEIVAKSN